MDMTQDMNAEASNSREVERIVELIRKLPEDERMEVFAEFCTHCGSDDPRCQCWNDE